MSKITFICPYFGKFPKHFKLWLKSCEKNEDCLWIIYTDDKEKYDYPNNVKVNYCELKDLKKRFSKKLGFDVALETIKKLGDYKPLYGFLFEEEIGDSMAWGHVDVNDSIYGKITNFITDDVINEYEKIMCCGHMSIYKNTKENNRRFMIPLLNGLDYKKIFSDNVFYNFEEIGENSITKIYIENKAKIKNMTGDYADITFRKFNMVLSGIEKDFSKYFLLNNNHCIFTWENGVLYGYFLNKGNIEKKEYIYIHIKRRKLNIDIKMDEEKYIICQNGFMPYEEVTQKTIKKYDKSKILYMDFLKMKYKEYVNRGKNEKNK